MLTRKDYELYLNDLGEQFSENEFIIGGKERDGKYGTMLRRHDKIAFEAGYREWTATLKMNYLKKGNTLIKKVCDKTTDFCDALEELETQMKTSDFGFSEGRIRKLTEAAKHLMELCRETREHFAGNENN